MGGDDRHRSAVHARASAGTAGGDRRAPWPGVPDLRGRRRRRRSPAAVAHGHDPGPGEARRLLVGATCRGTGDADAVRAVRSAPVRRRRRDGAAVRVRAVGRCPAGSGAAVRSACPAARGGGIRPAARLRTGGGPAIGAVGAGVRAAGRTSARHRFGGPGSGAADRVAGCVRGPPGGRERCSGAIGASFPFSAVDVGPLRPCPVRGPACGQARRSAAHGGRRRHSVGGAGCRGGRLQGPYIGRCGRGRPLRPVRGRRKARGSRAGSGRDPGRGGSRTQSADQAAGLGRDHRRSGPADRGRSDVRTELAGRGPFQAGQ